MSSANPDNVGLTLQGAVGLILMAALPRLGIDLSVNEITLAIETIMVVVSGIAFLAGLFRKIYLAYLDKKNRE
ncbi:MAG: hypothetical protein KAT66_00860 [Candidatus Lokiarchaeota archaeon]|nr:hypothetical protein [Candidatus Lokiarchaeota archaeon]